MQEGGCTALRQERLIAVVGIFLIGCAVLLAVGCAGTSSEAPKEEGQGHTEATNKDQTRSPEATASEEARCEGTRTFKKHGEVVATNDLPGCPNKGGLLLGTDKPDDLEGANGDDEIRGLGDRDFIFGGAGDDVIYAGPGDDRFLGGDDGPAAGDDVIYGGPGDEEEIIGGNGADVIYGGDGSDFLFEMWDRGHDKLYCGEGKDVYNADKKDFVSSSCEKKAKMGTPIP